MVLSRDNPFRETVHRNIQTAEDSDTGIILNERVVITRERQYLRGPWVRLTQDKEKLSNLSPFACKILIHIACNMNMNQEKIRLNRKDMGMDKRTCTRAIQELLGEHIIAFTGTREWYWINISLMIMGSITKHDNLKQLP